MAVITIPDGLLLGPECGWGQVRYDQVDESEADGSSDVRVRGRPRWTVTLVPPQKLRQGAEAQKWESMMLGLKGKTNVLAAYDPVRPQPASGTWANGTVSVDVPAGNSFFYFSSPGTAPGTQISIGDKIQIGTGFGTSELVRVTANATLAIAHDVGVNFDPPLRNSYVVGAVVTLVKPVAYFGSTGDRVSWSYDRTGLMVKGYSFSGLERWR